MGSLRIGGSQRVLIELLRGLDRNLFDAHLALMEDEGEFRERVPQDVPVYPLGVRRARLAALPVTSLCWRLRPHAILSFSAQLNAAVIAARLFLPRNTTIFAREGANVTLPTVASTTRRCIYRAIYPHADLVICQSDDMVERLSTCFHIPKSKLVRIYNSVDADRLRALAQGPSPYGNVGPNLVAVSRFVPVKGIDLLINAMQDVLRVHPHAILTLVGGGPQESYLRDLARVVKIAGAIRFVGFQTNPYPFIYNADVLVIPSRSEAFSNVALEALALGTPVVATDCPGGMREIARYTGHLTLATGIEPSQLANAITWTLADGLDHDPRHQADEEFLREFSPERVIALYQKTISLAAGAGGVGKLSSLRALAREESTR